MSIPLPNNDQKVYGSYFLWSILQPVYGAHYPYTKNIVFGILWMKLPKHYIYVASQDRWIIRSDISCGYFYVEGDLCLFRAYLMILNENISSQSARINRRNKLAQKL